MGEVCAPAIHRRLHRVSKSSWSSRMWARYIEPMDSAIARARELLRGHHGVRLVLAFGSRARGAATPMSDLDLAVSAPGMDLFKLAGELSERLGVEVDVVNLDDENLPIPLLEALVRDSVIVAEAAKGIAASWRTRTVVMLETDRPWYRRMRDAWLARVEERGL